MVDIAQLSAVCTRWFYLLQDKSLWESVSQIGEKRGCDATAFACRLICRNYTARTPYPLFRSFRFILLPCGSFALLCRIWMMQVRCPDSRGSFLSPLLPSTSRDALPLFTEFPESNLVDTNMPKLQSLDLGGSSAVDGATVQALVSATSVLRRLNLGGVVQLSDADMLSILPSTKNLRFLSMHDVRLISDATLGLVSQHAPGLLSLDVTGCPRLTSQAVVQLLAASTGQLRHMLLRGTHACTGATIHALSRFAPQLVELDASSDDVLLGSTAINDSDVQKLVQTCGGLRILKLQGQVALSDSKLARSMMMLPSLTELDLSACDGVGDETIETVARFCPGLRVLRIGETSVSNRGLAALACCRRLRILDVARCSELTLSCVLQTLRKLPALHHVLVGGVSTEGAQWGQDSLSVALAREVHVGHPSVSYSGRAAESAPLANKSACFVEFV